MNLAQRRISQAYQQEKFPAWKNKIDAAVGFDLPLEVKWDTMVSDSYDQQDDYFAWYDKVYFSPLLNALQQVCQDAMGKEAVKAGLKKVVIDGSEGTFPEKSAFEGGVFSVAHVFHTNVDDVNDRTVGWRKLLEAGL